ncbi:ABC transporter permease [Mycolicibacterium sp. CBM1]
MTAFALRRLASAAMLILLLTLLVFLLQKASPADGVKAYLGNGASPEAVAQARRQLGLDQPVSAQYMHYLSGLIHGDLGMSLRTRNPVATDLSTAAPATIELVLTAFVLALLMAAVYTATGSLRAGIPVRAGLLVAACAPSFLIGIAGLVVFYARLGWLPGGGRGTVAGPTGFGLLNALLTANPAALWSALTHLLLPALTLAIAPALAIGRVLRSSVRMTMSADYVRTAQSRGLHPARVAMGHVARNAASPALSMAGLQLGFMFAGVVVVEQVFNWPGIGNYLAASIPVADFAAIAGVTLLLAAIYIGANAVVDILQAAADPRLTL